MVEAFLLLLLFLVLLLLLLIDDWHRVTMGDINLMRMLLLLPVSSSLLPLMPPLPPVHEMKLRPLPPPEKEMLYLEVHRILEILLLGMPLLLVALQILLLHLDLHLFQWLLELKSAHSVDNDFTRTQSVYYRATHLTLVLWAQVELRCNAQLP
jgi:hypothetical protein